MPGTNVPGCFVHLGLGRVKEPRCHRMLSPSTTRNADRPCVTDAATGSTFRRRYSRRQPSTESFAQFGKETAVKVRHPDPQLREWVFFELDGPDTVLSSLNPAEKGDGLVARVRNPTECLADVAVRWKGPLANVHMVRLGEEPVTGGQELFNSVSAAGSGSQYQPTPCAPSVSGMRAWRP
jgi:hypothetical protein